MPWMASEPLRTSAGRITKSGESWILELATQGLRKPPVPGLARSFCFRVSDYWAFRG